MSEKIIEDDRRYTQVSKGIMVASDRNALKAYEEKTRIERSEKERINSLEQNMQNLNEKVNLILDLLQNQRNEE